LPNKARKIKRDRELRERKREREDPIWNNEHSDIYLMTNAK
jgi:hypothetical protein